MPECAKLDHLQQFRTSKNFRRRTPGSPVFRGGLRKRGTERQEKENRENGLEGGEECGRSMGGKGRVEKGGVLQNKIY